MLLPALARNFDRLEFVQAHTLKIAGTWPTWHSEATLHNPPTYPQRLQWNMSHGAWTPSGKAETALQVTTSPQLESRLSFFVSHLSLWHSKCHEWGNFSWNSGFEIESASGRVSRSESFSEEIQSYLGPVKHQNHQNSLLVGVKRDLLCKMICTIMRQTK